MTRNPGEAHPLALRWNEDVDLDKGAITVRHALRRVDGELKLVEPKSDQGLNCRGASAARRSLTKAANRISHLPPVPIGRAA